MTTISKSEKLTNSLDENLNLIRKIFFNDETIIFREFESDGKEVVKFCIIYIDSMVNKEIINENIIKPLINSSIKCRSEINNEGKLSISDFVERKILSSGQTNKSTDMDEIIGAVIYGYTLLLIQDSNEALIINTIGWQTRAIAESPSETVVRGSRESFTESINVNISLIRRRINDNDLKFKFKTLGTRTKTKVCICYIEGLAQEKILGELISRLDRIEIDGILESGNIEELISDAPLSPCRTIGYTERPDIVAAKLLEGRIALICEGTPFVLTLPYIFIEWFQSNEDYYNNFLFSSANRLIRFFGFFLTTSIPAIYVALANFHQELIPTPLLLSIAKARQGVPFPTVVETFVMLVIFEVLREAGTRIPKHLGQAISIVGALILGDAAINAKMVSAPVVIITAVTGIAAFLIPQVLGVIVVRIIFLLLASILGLYGYTFGVMGLALHMMALKSFGVPFMLNAGAGIIKAEDLKDTAIRAPWQYMIQRPRIIAKDIIRQKANKNRERR